MIGAAILGHLSVRIRTLRFGRTRSRIATIRAERISFDFQSLASCIINALYHASAFWRILSLLGGVPGASRCAGACRQSTGFSSYLGRHARNVFIRAHLLFLLRHWVQGVDYPNSVSGHKRCLIQDCNDPSQDWQGTSRNKARGFCTTWPCVMTLAYSKGRAFNASSKKSFTATPMAAHGFASPYTGIVRL